MMFPMKIRLATDGSAEADRAAQIAVELSERLDSELHVVHAWRLPAATPHPAPPYLSEPVVDALARDARRLLERGRAREAGQRLDERVAGGPGAGPGLPGAP